MKKTGITLLTSLMLVSTSVNFNAFSEENKKSILIDNVASNIAGDLTQSLLGFNVKKLDPNAIPCAINDQDTWGMNSANLKTCDYSVLKTKISKDLLFKSIRNNFNNSVSQELSDLIQNNPDVLSFNKDWAVDFTSLGLNLDKNGDLYVKDKHTDFYTIPSAVVLQIILEKEYDYKQKLSSTFWGIKTKPAYDALSDLTVYLLSPDHKNDVYKQKINDFYKMIEEQPDGKKIAMFFDDYFKELNIIRDVNHNDTLKKFVSKINEMSNVENKKQKDFSKKAKIVMAKYVEKQYKLTKIPKKVLQDHDEDSNANIAMYLEVMGGTSRFKKVDDMSFVIENINKDVLTNKISVTSMLFVDMHAYSKATRGEDTIKQTSKNYLLKDMAMNGEKLSENDVFQYTTALLLSPRMLKILNEMK